MKGFKTMDDVNLRHKTVLLRVDLNSAVVDGKVELSDRLIEHAKTIKEVVKKKARVVVIAHQGRKGESDFTSLKEHAKLLNKFVKIKFVDDIIGKKAVDAIKSLKDGEAILLENVRFLNEEMQPGKNNKLVKTLSQYFDYYINDAFSVSHRDQASITGFPRVIPGLIGRVMEKEINGAEKIRFGKVLFVLGGVKPEEHIDLLNSRKDAEVLTCGLFGQACAIASGYNLGKQNAVLKKKKINLKDLKKLIGKIDLHVPTDFAVDSHGKREEIDLEDFPSKHEIFDIGERTVSRYARKIKKARTVLMKGPAGRYEDKKFMEGTKDLLNAMIESKGYTIVAGGNTLSAMKHLNISKDKVKHVSLSGGAFIEHIAGKKLPGLEALKKSFLRKKPRKEKGISQRSAKKRKEAQN